MNTKKKNERRLLPGLLATALLLAVTVGTAPAASAACGDLDDRCTYPTPTTGVAGAANCTGFDPGVPGSGAVDATMWFVGQNVYLACGLADSVEDSVLLHTGDMAWKLGVVAVGGAELFNTDALVPAVLAYQGMAGTAAQSQAHDACGALVGEQNPTCGADPTMDQTLTCPGGAEIPNPIGGGLLGDSLDNTNGALQATCVLVGSWSATAPNATEVTTYADSVQLMLVELNGDVFAFASDANDALCVYLTGASPCI